LDLAARKRANPRRGFWGARMDAVWEGKTEKKASRRKQRGLLKYVLQSRTRKDVMGEISGLLGAKLQIKRDTIFTEKTR
jgi:hypothetical protein